MTVSVSVSEIEVAVAKHLDWRRNMIVPNVSWGLGLAHECDLLAVSRSGYAHEVEIKVSRSDLLRDQKKDKWKRKQKMIRTLWFAIPRELEASVPDIPEHAGVILVWWEEGHREAKCKTLRKPKINTDCRKLRDKEILHLGHLASLRIWSMKGVENRRRRGLV